MYQKSAEDIIHLLLENFYRNVSKLTYHCRVLPMNTKLFNLTLNFVKLQHHVFGKRIKAHMLMWRLRRRKVSCGCWSYLSQLELIFVIQKLPRVWGRILVKNRRIFFYRNYRRKVWVAIFSVVLDYNHFFSNWLYLKYYSFVDYWVKVALVSNQNRPKAMPCHGWEAQVPELIQGNQLLFFLEQIT